MDNNTLLAALDFCRNRLIATLDAIEKSGYDAGHVLAYRPGPGRAHISWQFAHLAATHDRYLNVRLHGREPNDAAFTESFGGGSTPSDTNVPSVADLRSRLESNYVAFRKFVESATPAELARKITLPNGTEITVGTGVLMMIWHESHHQGQIHLTWNLYKAAYPK